MYRLYVKPFKDLVEHVMRARYGNLYALLKDHVSEAQDSSRVRSKP